MAQNSGFPFGLLIDKEFTCSQSGKTHVVTAADEAGAKSGQSNSPDGYKPYWDVPCPHCSGVHRFWRGNSNHRIGQVTLTMATA